MKKLLIIIGAILCVFYSLPYFQAEKIYEWATLQQELTDEPISLKSVFTRNPFVRIPTSLGIQRDLLSLESMKQEKQSIEDNFRFELQRYIETLSEYIPFPLKTLSQDTSTYPLSVKRHPDVFIQNLKPEVRSEIRTFNATTDDPVVTTLGIDAMMNNMTESEKRAQMVIMGITGTALTNADRIFLSEYQPGGVILMGENIRTPEQTRTLIDDIQSTNKNIPLFVSVDQEGGVVSRITWENLPGQPQLTNASKETICSTYEKRSGGLHELGFNLNFGLVADMTDDVDSFIQNRVFGNSPDRISQNISTALKCTQMNLSTVKHFPGHGATSLDTHEEIATIPLNENDWKGSHAQPFISAIGQDADALMIGHLVLSWLDTQPATLSESTINYLRDDMNFSGLTITDDLRMLEASGMRPEETWKQSFEAGNDLLLTTQKAGESDTLMRTLSTYDRDVDDAFRRIMKAKNKVIKMGRYVPYELIH